MFFSDANWCWPAGGFEKVGLKLDFFPLGLHGVIGSSDRSLKIEWVDKPCEKDEETEEKNEPMSSHILMPSFKLSLFPIHS